MVQKSKEMQSVLIFGASGKIGHSLFLGLSKHRNYQVKGTVRKESSINLIPEQYHHDLIPNIDVFDLELVSKVISKNKPNIIINAVGLVKQEESVNDVRISFPLNSLWPHELSRLALANNAHVIQLSSDCVYSGNGGMYTEQDIPDPTDVYGQTKWLGELTLEHCTTIRTSTIGHELNTKHGLLNWFLSQEGSVNGYTNAIYSGFPTAELANIFANYLIPNLARLPRLLHIASNPISKYDLLKKIATKYQKKVTITLVNEPHCDRSLSSVLFNKITNYQTPNWDQLISSMYKNYLESKIYENIR